MAVRLTGDEREIPLNPFVANYLQNILRAIGSSLKGTEGARRLEFHLEGKDLRLLADGREIPLHHGKGFAGVLVTDTLQGILKHLKGTKSPRVYRISVDL